MSAKTIFFQSLGCPKNLVDSEVMLGLTQKANYQIVEDPNEASIIIVNTCSFINDAKEESIDTLLQLAECKKTGNCKQLIVTGCLVQRYKPEMMQELPEVDAFVGTGQYQDILAFIQGKREEPEGFDRPRYIHDENTPRTNTQPSHRAFLKISEGCLKHCSFCIIPKIRGTLRSRSVPSLVEETRLLVAQGVKEINLTGQNLTDYGLDRKDGTQLTSLLKKLVRIDGLEWIRLHYLYPDELADDLVEAIATEEKICNYLDMPIQHIDDRILGLMNRQVTGEAIQRRIETLRRSIPNLSLRTTLLVGYPSETDTEFNALKSFVQEAKFDHLGVFPYSDEEDTAAHQHPGKLPQALKEQRCHEIMRLQQPISKNLLENRVNQVYSVLVEGLSDESEYLWQGRHEGQAPEIDGVVLLHSGDFQRGEIRSVKIERAMEYDLIGIPT